MADTSQLHTQQAADLSLARPTAPDALAFTAVVGLGYVGLPLCLQFARCGHRVLGLDVDQKKIDDIRAGKSYISHIPAEDIAKFVGEEAFEASDDFQRVEEASTVIICVPTPLSKHREPDLSYILMTGRAIAPHLQPGTLVVLESTTYPGTTDTELRQVLENGSGLKAGEDFHLAFSPEREDPGNPASHVGRIPKVVGGYTQTCLEKAVELYSTAVDQVVPVSSCRAAEATKLLENIYRSVNIALVNELKVIYDAMDIDVWEVIGSGQNQTIRLPRILSWPRAGWPLYPDRSVLSHLEGERVWPSHPVYRAGGRNQHRHASPCGRSGWRGTQRPQKVDQRKPHLDSRLGLQAQRRRLARVAQFYVSRRAVRQRRDGRIPRPLRPRDRPNSRTCFLGGHPLGRVDRKATRQLRRSADQHRPRLRRLRAACPMGTADRRYAQRNARHRCQGLASF